MVAWGCDWETEGGGSSRRRASASSHVGHCPISSISFESIASSSESILDLGREGEETVELIGVGLRSVSDWGGCGGVRGGKLVGENMGIWGEAMGRSSELDFVLDFVIDIAFLGGGVSARGVGEIRHRFLPLLRLGGGDGVRGLRKNDATVRLLGDRGIIKFYITLQK